MTVEVDLHLHTTASDGALAPGRLLQAAAERGLKAVAITDHDTTAGLAEAAKAAQRLGLEMIPGIELSTEWRDKEVHVLGYWPEYEQEWFQAELSALRQGRADRVARIVKKLSSLGYLVSLERVKEIAGEGAVGRPHVARALVEAGYCRSIREAFERLLVKGAPAYIPREKLTPGEALRLVRRAKGVPVLAHPGLIGNDSIITELLDKGLAGIEVFYPEHSLDEQAHYRVLAERWQLVTTGGSDFHGIDEGTRDDLGICGIKWETLVELKKVKERVSDPH